MSLTHEPLTLELANPFNIAHGVSQRRHNVLVRLHEGLGEAAAVPYLGQTPQRITADLDRAAQGLGSLEGLAEVRQPEQLELLLARLPTADSTAARAAVSMALYDLWARRRGQPLYQLLGLDPARCPPTSFTVAMDRPEVVARRARDCGMPLIKLKLGGPDDEALVAAVRQATTARLQLDANGAWTAEQAARLLPRLARYDVELVEQPLPPGELEGLRWLRQRVADVPLFVDESVHTAQDVTEHASLVDGVVIKLAKAGGVGPALEAIAAARAAGLKVMLSCMIESSLAVTAAAHLAPLCDLADLDAPLLLARDPFVGLGYSGAELILPCGAGLGVGNREQRTEDRE